MPSNTIAINKLDKNKFFSLVTFITYLRNSGSKRISKNKDNNKLFSFIIFVKYL